MLVRLAGRTVLEYTRLPLSAPREEPDGRLVPYAVRSMKIASGIR